ncbi:hypothetical protein P3C29_07670 [Pseudomonas sp. 1912-s]|uniref:hypothetical protein n=1 Tax=Pseudomonas sp. 1912-s TaxID=3033802 RepID=UPI0023E01093|nr:hypothetical protein [Pseudomonas sp. 1912-s]MDF3198553.1 hypothetical protein [Pseudomonas sp. 1912-s]
MAYEIHIERVESSTIAPEEWHSFCANDPSMNLESETVGVNPKTGETITVSGNETAFWTSPVTQQQYYFDYRRGSIAFVYSDEALAKAREIARAFSANIRGDEGEAY